jgi:AraC family transcriptional regulator
MHHGSFAYQSCSAAGRPNSPSEHRGCSRISTEVAEILAEICIAVDRSPEVARAAALRLVSLLTPCTSAVSAASRGGLAPWQKRKVDCYLRDHLERPLQVKQLAQQVSLSVSHFCRAFKDSFGTTPHMHIIGLRLERAKHLMLATQDPLSEIALRCGLADQAHLSKLFRRWTGETPNAWRRRNFNDAHMALRVRRSIASRIAGPRLAA